MTAPHIDRRTASTQAKVAQAAFGVVALGAGALAVVGLPGEPAATPPEALVIAVVQPPAPAGGIEALTGPVDGTALSARLASLGNSPRTPQEVTIESVEAPPPPPPTFEVRYIGVVSIGPRYMGIIIDNSRQRVVKVGDSVADGSKVIGVTPDELTLEDSAKKQRSIPMADRSGESFSRAVAAAPNKTGPTGPAVKVLPVKPNPAMSPQKQAAAAGMTPIALAPGGGGGRHSPGSPERFNEIVADLKRSGQYGSEDALMEAAKMQQEQEMAKQQEMNGGGSK